MARGQPALSEAQLRARFLVPFLPLSAQRPARALNQAMDRYIPGATRAPRRGYELLNPFVDPIPKRPLGALSHKELLTIVRGLA